MRGIPGSIIYGEPVFPPRNYPVETVSPEVLRETLDGKQTSIPVALPVPAEVQGLD